MTVVEALKAGPLPATHIAAMTGLPLVDAYQQLVAAEARGLVRVNTDRQGANGHERKFWEAMAEEIAP